MTKVVGVYSGKVAQWRGNGKRFETAIFKTRVAGKVAITVSGITDDFQADQVHHGGPDKALCLFASEQYNNIEKQLALSLPRPAFGENLLVSGVDDRELCIGDILCIGTTKLQVSQPRRPCYKISAVHGEPKLAHYFQQTGYTGCYLRCLEPGQLQAGDEIVWHHGEETRVSILDVNRILYGKEIDPQLINQLLALKSIATSLRATLKKRLEGAEVNDRRRLYGEFDETTRESV
ncbi:MOSC domain-containing protein [Teredinibacter turnerae]|uniref:MOSC domain-containing protein n=1 Tax=Teredinibacter turnerae TaxID=2426 RepID=UPI0030D4EC4F